MMGFHQNCIFSPKKGQYRAVNTTDLVYFAQKLPTSQERFLPILCID
jgi:hypothetical protein